MKANGKRLLIASVLGSFFIFACVTINIYFPAEKVESVAGEIVNEIRGESREKDKSSSLENIIYAFIAPVAHADEITEVSNPTIRALKQSMKNRYVSLKPFYQKGLLDEGPDGFVSLKGGDLGLKEKRALRSLIDAENRDRNKLYEEIAKALKIDQGQVAKIAKIFAKEWQKPVR